MILQVRNTVVWPFVYAGAHDRGRLEVVELERLALEAVDGFLAAHSAVNFLKGGSASFGEIEVDGDKLDDEHAEEEEVESGECCVSIAVTRD